MVGLVHISEIANTYVKNVKDFIQEGDVVKVRCSILQEKLVCRLNRLTLLNHHEAIPAVKPLPMKGLGRVKGIMSQVINIAGLI